MDLRTFLRLYVHISIFGVFMCVDEKFKLKLGQSETARAQNKSRVMWAAYTVWFSQTLFRLNKLPPCVCIYCICEVIVYTTYIVFGVSTWIDFFYISIYIKSHGAIYYMVLNYRFYKIFKYKWVVLNVKPRQDLIQNI